MKKIILFLSLFLLAFCTNQKSPKENLSTNEKIENLVSNQDFKHAIKLLNNADPAIVKNIDLKKKEIYKAHGKYLIKQSDTLLAAEQFTNILKINKEDEIARSYLKLIFCNNDNVNFKKIEGEGKKLIKNTILPLCNNIYEKVDQLIAEDNYPQALDVLNDARPDQTEANLDTLKEKVHLNYGIFLEYRGDEDTGMRERMTGALRQYVEVLKINPDNEKAISEVQQIMGIYSTMPDKSPGDDLMEDLHELGFDF